MKFLEIEFDTKGKRRYTFTFGKSEAELLYNILLDVYRYRSIAGKPDRARINNIKKALGDALPQMKESQAKEKGNKVSE